MSFGGGGGGAGLISHTHNSSIPQDGGDLSIPVTNISGMPLTAWAVALS